MINPSLGSLIQSGTKLWLDSVDPRLVVENAALGATGATSNPIIIADLLLSGRYDEQIVRYAAEGLSNADIAWRLTDEIVRAAQREFFPVWERTGGNDGYVSFELDPLVEDPDQDLAHDQKISEYIRLGKQWSSGNANRMIKVPATPAGLDALEELAASGVPLNVTLIFSARQHQLASEAVWRGIQRQPVNRAYKSVYSIFVSRIDVFTQQFLPELPATVQGLVGIVNAKRIWQNNFRFWADKHLPLQQEIIFASTGTKEPRDLPWKYVEALAGSDIQTNPPATNMAVAASGKSFSRTVDLFPPPERLGEIDRWVDMAEMERVLMEQGIEKFAAPQRQLLGQIALKREQLASTTP